jgi:atypical dual specificity phosphatase
MRESSPSSRLRGELESIHSAGVSRVICLVPRADLPELCGLPDYAELCAAFFGEGHRFVEVVDYAAPGRVRAFTGALVLVDDALRAGAQVLAHCGAGCGRTGTFVACLLVIRGLDPFEALARYRRLWGCGPESAEQAAFVHDYARALRVRPDLRVLEDP